MKKETALVIMAAGIGSRFGTGIKQLEKVGPGGEIIMDYSIHDALLAGFDKVIFIIRKDIEAEFREVIGNRIEKVANIAYAYQDLHDLPAGFSLPEGRKKPWGTAQAVLAARDLIDCPFLVINADDFYGAEGYRKVHEYLAVGSPEKDGKMNLCMAGFILSNTLSENGTVTRGVCTADSDGNLLSVEETFEIIEKDGKVSGERDGKEIIVSRDDIVSMNMFGLQKELVDVLWDRFPRFLEKIPAGDIKAEYLLPTVINELIQEGKANVQVLPTHDRWYGMTYHEDTDYVKKAILDMIRQGVYKEKLFG